MTRFLRGNVEEGLCILLVTGLCAVITLQVFFRLVLRDPLSWSEELSTIIFIWTTMIGASLALKRGEHFAVELLHGRLKAADRRIAGGIVGTLLIIFSLILIWEGAGLTIRNIDVVTPAMEISRSFAYAAVPVGGLFMLVRSIEILIGNIRHAPPAPPPGAPQPQANVGIEQTRPSAAAGPSAGPGDARGGGPE
jgi:TRAP-type transport system small permease protein